MKKKIYIRQAEIKPDNVLQLLTDEKHSLDTFVAAGQILVDSEDCSFVYLLEKENEYTYMVIKEDYWPQLRYALEANAAIYLVNDNGRLELVDFLEELSFLIENIKGNSNYGADMVQKVEQIF